MILEELFGSPEACISTPCDNACDACYSQGIRAPIYDEMFFPVNRIEVSKFICGVLLTTGSVNIFDFVTSFSSMDRGHTLFYNKSKSRVLKGTYELTILQLIAAEILCCNTDEVLNEDGSTHTTTTVSLGYEIDACATMCSIISNWEYIKHY